MGLYGINGALLGRGGQLAGSSDCCCDDPCIQCQSCPHCWNSVSDPCAELDSIDITISGVTAGTGGCSCSTINSTYTYDIQSRQCGFVTVKLIDNCLLSLVPGLTLPFSHRYSVEVTYIFGFKQADIPITTQSELMALSSGELLPQLSKGGWPSVGSRLFNAFTLSAGHYIGVIVNSTLVYIPSQFVSRHEQQFLYSFANSAVKPGCPDDQIYGLCSGLIGGTATNVWSTSFSSATQVTYTNSAYADFGFSELCNMSGLTVTIGDAVIIATPPPPPP